MVQLGDLSDDCLIALMDRLPPKQLFKVKRLNQRMKRLATIKLEVKIEAVAIKASDYRLIPRCSHFDSIRSDQLLVIELPESMIRQEVSSQLILRVLSQCPGVKALDWYLQSSHLLLEAFRRCPELECVKLRQLYIKQDKWDCVLDEIGQRIVHLAIFWNPGNTTTNSSFQTPNDFLKSVAAKCSNIKRIEWCVGAGHNPNSDLMAAFKLLPASCWIKLVCSQTNYKVTFEDVVDELDTIILYWADFGQRYDRLKTLKFINVECSVHEVVFNGLKRLDLSDCDPMTYRDYLNYIIASRFTTNLVELGLLAIVGITDDDYESVFRKTPSVSRLFLRCGHNWSPNCYPLLPRPSTIRLLKNLEFIDLKISHFENEWEQPNDFFWMVEQYVDEVGSLKKITIDMRYCKKRIWDAAVEEQVKRLKLKQSKVKVVLIDNSKF